MKIKSVSVRGYRTLKDEIVIDVEKSPILVGPNNSGKTNALRALKNFFTGYENIYNYDFEIDIPQGEKALRTNIQCTLTEIEEPHDQELIEVISQLRSYLGLPEQTEKEITLYLTFSQNSNPVYRVFPNNKRPVGADGTAYSRAERRLFEIVLSRFSVHYIPSEKSIPDLYRSLVLPFLFQKVHEVIEPHLEAIKAALRAASDAIDEGLNSVGLGKYRSSFSLPRNAQDIYKGIDFNLLDNNVTSVFSKGMGVQSATLFSAFCWIAQQERQLGKQSLWLIEEPESYLHPELSAQCLGLIEKLSGVAQVVITTHSLNFVPDHPDRVLGVSQEDGWTRGTRYRTYHEATREIRKSLGVRFSDFYNLSKYNVFVEGPTDRNYLEFVVKTLANSNEIRLQYPLLCSGDVSIQDFGGVKGLEGFLKATFEFVRTERPCITVLDGDDAGDITRKSLQNYFGNKGIGFQANSEYVVVRDRFAIEGLLPDEWIDEIGFQHPGWFDNFGKDAQGVILPFKVKDGSKDQYFNWFKDRVARTENFEWASRWRGVLEYIEKGLTQKRSSIYGAKDQTGSVNQTIFG